MKKTILSMLFAFAAVSVGAQDMYDALDLSENNYYGTARSIALGNAMTALGGDLGSIGINPAGSAVAGYSQFTFTPAFSTSFNKAQYSAYYDDPYSAGTSDSRTRFTMPNLGYTLSFDTYRTRGLKNWTLGIISNSTNSYVDRFSAGGLNAVSPYSSSMFGSLAYGASGYSEADVNSYNSGVPWDYVTAYKSGLIGRINTGTDDNFYAGTTEKVSETADGYQYYIPGDIEQHEFRQVAGTKNDLVMNVGLNFSDCFYLGFNIGVPTASYIFDETYYEQAVNPSDFSVLYDDGTTKNFSRGEYKYAYNASSTGIYAKIGFIWLPFAGLRIGAAFQTPTEFTISETYQSYGCTTFSNGDDTWQRSPKGEYQYCLSAPARFNVGAAYTFGGFGLVSFDYEAADYSNMSYYEYDRNFYGSGEFDDVNKHIAQNARYAQCFRAGLEFRPLARMSLRGGFSMNTNPVVDVKNSTKTYSFGAGYSSDDSFFFDFAARLNQYPSTSYFPYSDYNDADPGKAFPEILAKRNVMDLVFTFGWRF